MEADDQSPTPVLRPNLILITGQGGSGKTTLAHRLSSRIGCPAVCRDEIKEGMVHAYGPGFAATTGDPLTTRTYPLFFRVIRTLLDGGVTTVAEATFQHRVWVQGLEPLMQSARLRIVRCHAAPHIRLERRRARLSGVQTRAAHADVESLARGVPAEWDAIHLDAPTLDVDATDGYDPDLDSISAFCGRR